MPRVGSITPNGIDPRRALGDRLRALVGSGSQDLARAADDLGLLGADPVAATVHGDFAAMMVGGVASLLLQMLHPAALAGVWDHSDFRRDRNGRLRRTAQFIAMTTYGPTAAAEAQIARVRRIHARVTGTTADGTPYRADDPALLRWVHVAETWCFLAAHRRYRAPAMPVVEQDRYCAEMAIVADRLGATDVPRTRAAIDAALRAARPTLRYDARTAAVARALLAPDPESRALAPVQAVLVAGAADLLPRWAAAMHGLDRPALLKPGIRLGMGGLGQILRWALRPA
jgi:uncharacterized protein (DUF2236 family)